jgi:hypothetical protein
VATGHANPEGTMDSQERKTDNRRTGWILATVVVVFFLGVIARRWLVG